MVKPRTAFEPTPGSQTSFLTCPAWEVLYDGPRGTGKTTLLLMDYLQHVGVGFGQAWRGILFRMTYTQLTDIVSQSKQWIPQIFPSAKFNGSDHVWKFEGGEELLLRYIRTEDDYWQYHGWQLPWCAFEELTTWPTLGPYMKMMSCNRSAHKDIPRKYRSTTNPSGPGHAAVKNRFIDFGPPNKIIIDKFGQARCRVPSSLEENIHLMDADPLYLEKLKMLTQDNPNLAKAWIGGSWDLLAGGALMDIWDRKIHVIESFRIPSSWKIYRSFDWGSAKPWCITYGAESNGEQPIHPDLPYIPKNSIFLVGELYGWNGMPDEGDRATSQEIANRCLRYDRHLELEYGVKVITGPADTGIWEVRDGTSIAANMATLGCHWIPAYKGPGSRISGLALIRQMLGAAKRMDLEQPHLYMFENAIHHIRTFPLLQYSSSNPEDIDSDSEDHCFTGETLIQTDKGLIPIQELVGTEGKVLSINGEYVPYNNCKKYFNKSKLLRVTFEDGYFVDCTPDHEFLTLNGLVRADSLFNSMCVISKGEEEWQKSRYCQKPSKSFLEWFTISVDLIFKEKGFDFTEKFTNTFMDGFQQNMMSTTMMKTKSITNREILNWFMNLYIVLTTKKDMKEECPKSVLMLLQNGIKVLMEESGIWNIMKKRRNPYIQKLKENVPSVENYTPPIINKSIHFVQIIVNLLLEEHRELTILSENVKFVPQYLLSINTSKEEPVQVNAKDNFLLKPISLKELHNKEETYCLTVPSTSVFALGNGVLVSNCYDSTRYLLSRKMLQMKRRMVRI